MVLSTINAYKKHKENAKVIRKEISSGEYKAAGLSVRITIGPESKENEEDRSILVEVSDPDSAYTILNACSESIGGSLANNLIHIKSIKKKIENFLSSVEH